MLVDLSCHFAGVDEAGRGPLAGPVCAAAVLPGCRSFPAEICDSKKITAAKRQRLEPEIKRQALSWGIGWASVEEIDTTNILAAAMLAMRRALAELKVHPSVILVDGITNPYGYRAHKSAEQTEKTVRCVKGGDNKYRVIAAASILAKVARDKYMRDCAAQYPQYGFDSHMGYGTKQHMQALQTCGVTPIHRKSFGPVARLLGHNKKINQPAV